MSRSPAEPAYRKSLGQHHLVRPELCRPALDFLEHATGVEGRLCVEIGPGGGVLTQALLLRGARVFAWELDREWAFTLAQRVRGMVPGAGVVVGDALELPWERLPAGCLVTGNLPFQVGTAIVEDFVWRAEAVSRAAFMLQEEVARRLVAGPGTREYGFMTALIGARMEVSYLGRVRAGSFRPPPAVDGAFVGLRRRALLPEVDLTGYRSTLSAAFRLRRKTLRNSLRSAWDAETVAMMLESAEIDGGRRAEALSVKELLGLHAARLRVETGTVEARLGSP